MKDMPNQEIVTKTLLEEAKKVLESWKRLKHKALISRN